VIASLLVFPVIGHGEREPETGATSSGGPIGHLPAGVVSVQLGDEDA